MQWNQIRKQYLNKWVVIEAVKAHSIASKRMLDDISVLDVFDNSTTAMHNYSERHRDAPQRELLVVHTSREALDIEERHWVGVRA